MLKILIVWTYVSYSYEFLLDSSTQKPIDGLMTDIHYDNLLKFFMDERNARLQLQQYVIQHQQTQQQQNAVMEALKTRVEQLEQASVANRTEIENKYTQLAMDYTVLKHEHVVLENKLQMAENRTEILEEEIRNLKSIKVINQLQSLDGLQKQIQSMQSSINTLTSQGQARGQDLIALYNNFDQEKAAFKGTLTALNHSIHVLHSNTSDELQNLSTKQHGIESQVQTIIHNITDHGFTAFGTSYGTKSYGTTLKFPVIKSSFGLLNLSTFKSTGTFTCEKSGIYLISVTVMSGSVGDSGFGIYGNSSRFGYYFVGRAERGETSQSYNSGSGTILVQLNKGDTVSVKAEHHNMYVYGESSSVTVIKQN